MHCEEKLKLWSYTCTASYCLIQAVTNSGLTLYTNIYTYI